MRYRYEGELELRTPRRLLPGDEFETDQKITHPHFKLLPPKKSPKEPLDADN